MNIAYARMGNGPMNQTDCPGLGMDAINSLQPSR
jgi:hypothetical protein